MTPCDKCGGMPKVWSPPNMRKARASCECGNETDWCYDRPTAKRSWERRVVGPQRISNARKVAESITRPPPVVEAVRRGRCTPESVARSLRMDPVDVIAELEAATADGYAIAEEHGTLSLTKNYQDRAYYIPWESGEPVSWLCLTDTHAGHRGFESSALTECVTEAVEVHDVDFVTHTGDIVDSLKHAGQSYEQRRSRIHSQCLEFLSALPYYKHVKHLMICGNHDEWFFGAGHMEVTQMIWLLAKAQGRDDIIPLGTEQARIQLGTGDDAIRIMLSHQNNKKAVNKQQGPDRPDVFIQGHYHDQVFRRYGGIAYLRPGGFQTTSRFFNKMGGSPDITAVILDVTKDKGRTWITPNTLDYPRQHSVWITPEEAAELEAQGIGWE